MGDERIVNYLKEAEAFFEDNHAKKSTNTVPDVAGKQVVDYLAVSEWWQEVRDNMFRTDREDG